MDSWRGFEIISQAVEGNYTKVAEFCNQLTQSVTKFEKHVGRQYAFTKKKSLVKSLNVLQHDAIVQLQKHDLSPVLSKVKLSNYKHDANTVLLGRVITNHSRVLLRFWSIGNVFDRDNLMMAPCKYIERNKYHDLIWLAK